jgi:hypothetical protein
LKIYPNPFFDDLNIGFNLQENTKVTVIIYDARGRLISKPIDTYLSTGQYKYNWEPTSLGLTQSMYMLRFMAGDKVLHTKLIRAR